MSCTLFSARPLLLIDERSPQHMLIEILTYSFYVSDAGPAAEAACCAFLLICFHVFLKCVHVFLKCVDVGYDEVRPLDPRPYLLRRGLRCRGLHPCLLEVRRRGRRRFQVELHLDAYDALHVLVFLCPMDCRWRASLFRQT